MMELRGIKFSILSNLLFLCISGMLLMSVVFITLWYARIVRLELTALSRLLTVQAETFQKENIVDSGKFQQKLQSLCAAIGSTCREIFLYEKSENSVALSSSIQSETKFIPVDIFSPHFNRGFGSGSWLRSLFHGHPYHISIGLPHQNNYEIRISMHLPALTKVLGNEIILIVCFIVVNSLILATIGFFRLARVIIKPLDRLVELAGKHGDEMDVLLRDNAEGNELRRLSFAINSLVGQIDGDREKLRRNVAELETTQRSLVSTQKEVARAEKLASIGRLSAGLAHEIGNPIGIVQGYISLLSQPDLSTEERADFARRADIELTRVGGLIRNMLDFSRPSGNDPGTTSLAACLDHLLPILRAQKETRHITFTVHGDRKNDAIAVSAAALHQVLLNCLLNAVDAIAASPRADDGEISICYFLKAGAENEKKMCIEIKDNGCGIAADHLDTVLDPFFSTKEPGKGTGLGLSVSHSLISAVGGTLHLHNAEPFGAVVCIELPLADQQIEKVETPHDGSATAE